MKIIDSIIKSIEDDETAVNKILEHNLNVNTKNGFNIEFTLKDETILNITNTTKGVISSDLARNTLGHLENLRRKRRYNKMKTKYPVILAEGDSWFSHPLLDDIVDNLYSNYAILSMSHPGDLVSNMASENNIKKIQRAIEEENPRLILLSGGGNDTIGQKLSHWLKTSNKTNHIEDLLNLKNLEDHISEVEKSYKHVIEACSKNKNIHIILHGYDYAIPVDHGDFTNRRLGGAQRAPWLSQALDEKNIIDPNLRSGVIHKILDLLNEMLARLAKNYQYVQYLDLRNTFDRTDPSYADIYWYDEIHPSEYGFKLINEKFQHIINQTISSS